MLSDITEDCFLKIKLSIAAHLWLRLYILPHGLPWNSGIFIIQSAINFQNEMTKDWFQISKIKTLISSSDCSRPCQTIWCFFGCHSHNFQVKNLLCHKSPKVALNCHKLQYLIVNCHELPKKLPYFVMNCHDMRASYDIFLSTQESYQYCSLFYILLQTLHSQLHLQVT